jgi:hypothetical protein
MEAMMINEHTGRFSFIEASSVTGQWFLVGFLFFKKGGSFVTDHILLVVGN